MKLIELLPVYNGNVRVYSNCDLLWVSYALCDVPMRYLSKEILYLKPMNNGIVQYLKIVIDV